MHSSTKTALASLLVIALGWGIGYTAFNAAPITAAIRGIAGQRAAAVETSVTVVDAVPADSRDATPITTSVVSSRGQDTPSSDDAVTVLIGGDIMFDRGIRAIGDRAGYVSLFDHSLRELFARADIVVANLEGPITDDPSKTLVDGKTTDSFTFTFPPQSADALRQTGIDVVSLANNHTDNALLDGYKQTQAYLERAGVNWFGNPWNSTSTRLLTDGSWNDSPSTTYLERRGTRVAFIGYHGFHSGIDTIISEVRRAAATGAFVVVMPHWGNEYTPAPTEQMRRYARALIDTGADAIIGAHSHVVGENEWIDGTPVFYSLGNLLFDQYFSDEVKRGMLVELSIRGQTLERLRTYDTSMRPGIGVTLEE